MAGILVALVGPPAPAADGVDFNRDVRPILSDKCFFCHGPDPKQRKAGLRLDDREVAVKKKAIVPGRPAESELIDRINAADDDARMPPAHTHKTLTAAQKDTIKRWVAAGASYAPHWAYVAPTRPASSVPGKYPQFDRITVIDSLIRAKLTEKKIAPSPEADKARLLRRLSLDLTGLPPTPEELRQFLTDRSPRAYEHQVDLLLASPQFGERMAVAWLDLARFADTVGYHGDQNQHIFPYRDYVIDAFNSNKPYDKFVIEQLAGDLLPNATTEQKVASGFNRLNMVTREGGAQPKEYLAKYAADRVRTVSTTFLGSTMGCCECHDHKYDPFTIRDFYSMAAFFADVKQWGVYQDYDYTPNPDLKGWSNDHPFPPEIVVTSPYLVRRAERLRHQIRELAYEAFEKTSKTDLPAFLAWSAAVRDHREQHPDGWEVPPVAGTKAAIAEPRVVDDGSVFLGGPAKKSAGKKAAAETIEVTLKPDEGPVAALRLELLPDDGHEGRCFRDGRDSATIKLSATLKPKDGRPVTVKFHRADAEHETPRYQNGEPAIGVLGGWRTDPKFANQRQPAVWLLDPVAVADGDELVVKLAADGLGRVRLAVSPVASLDPLGPPPSLALDGIATPYLISSAHDPEAYAKCKVLERDLLECRGGKTWSLVTESWKPAVTRVLPRGNWQDESGPMVEPAVPAFLPALVGASGSQRLTRLDLANWIVAKDNPLTARAFVNRLWKQFFGTGLSAVVDDLGAQGEPPSHPELLDWLACEFRDTWDVKRLVKLIVMSQTYRQDSRSRQELKDIDPQDRLLAYQNPRRLEAEFVHDNALFVAGLLDTEVGGPSAHPYQPAGYYAAIQFPDRDYYPEKDERQYRRGVYMWWQRTFLHPMLANFDAPSREECCAYRVVSNTPQQALTLLNSPIFIEAARVFAARLMATQKTDEARLAAAFERVLARKPKAEEQTALLKYLAEQTAYYRDHPEAVKKVLTIGNAPRPAGVDEPVLAGWTAVCRVLLNLHETITRY
jgi:hypothetical protein